MSLTLRQNWLPSLASAMTAETARRCLLGVWRGLWLRLCKHQIVKPVRRRGEVEEVHRLDAVLPGHVLGAAVANANGRCHDDVAAFAADIDVRPCQSAGAVGHRPVRVPLEQDVLPAARRNLGVRCRKLAMLLEKARPDRTTVRLLRLLRRIGIDRPDAGPRSHRHADHRLRPVSPPVADCLLVGGCGVKAALDETVPCSSACTETPASHGAHSRARTRPWERREAVSSPDSGMSKSSISYSGSGSSAKSKAGSPVSTIGTSEARTPGRRGSIGGLFIAAPSMREKLTRINLDVLAVGGGDGPLTRLVKGGKRAKPPPVRRRAWLK